MKNLKGSEWRRWDFHIHTPYSLLNNNFNVNLEIDNEFDYYVKELFKRALDNNISAIGITDYFFIDGYKKIKNEYLDKEEKMLSLFSEEEYEKIKDIYVFPNIELRLQEFVHNENSINIHVIFSDELDIEHIEEEFIHRLEFNKNKDLRLTKKNVINLGKELLKDNGNNNPSVNKALKYGIQNISISLDNLLEKLEKEIFSSKYILVFPPDEDLSDIDWKGQSHEIKKRIYSISDCLFASNPNTIDWGLAKSKGYTQTKFIKEFRSIKPSIWGSDAHSYDKMFKPDQNRYCWIKADLSFNGLTQILYEPEDRVKIQCEKPEEKESYRVIDHIIIDDKNFSDEPIYFNENLNCIIGGKSTGKSILLNNIANSIDEEQVNKKNQNIGYKVNNLKVYWKDGVCSNSENNRKITYIPQTYLNKLAEENNTVNEIDKIIESILLDNEHNQIMFNEKENKIHEINNNIKKAISDYIITYNNNIRLKEQLLEKGDSRSILTEINSLESKITDTIEDTELEEKNKEYNNLENNIKIYNDSIIELENDLEYLKNKENIEFDLSFLENIKRQKLKDDIVNKLNELVSDINNKWITIKNNIISEYTERKNQTITNINNYTTKKEELKKIIEKNELLKNINNKISEENKKLEISKKLENEIENNKKILENILQNILKLRNEYYDVLSNYVNSLTIPNYNNLKFQVSIIPNYEKLKEYILNIFNKKTISKFNKYDIYNINDDMLDNNFFKELFLHIMNDGKEFAELKININKEEALVKIFSNWYNIKYTVSMDNDVIGQMSPGKKSLVLLKLLIELSNSEYPILLDQPEDDLDNRSIFNDLVQYIKDRKKKRQIILVTHNANIVLGGDAEQVIIANQEGDNSPNDQYKFEYRTGTIENNRIDFREYQHIKYLASDSKPRGILYTKNIQTHICEILEGGKNAFKIRYNRYKNIEEEETND